MQPMWQPDDRRIEAANMTRFRNRVNERYGLVLDSYASLHKWSIQNSAEFWSLLWDFAEVRASIKGENIVDDADKMPGARWFPDARLNFAENLLRNSSDKTALVFRGEDRTHRVLSYRELQQQVSRFAQAMQAMGIDKGDRVSAYIPNMPETVIAMLAATTLGAIWSSCSPDFGPQGVLDRFSQIQPKLLISTDRYFYGGREFPMQEKVRTILSGLPSIEQLLIFPYDGENLIGEGFSDSVSAENFVRDFSAGPIHFVESAFDHPLYILYSSGTTGVPKCIVHGVGGTLLKHQKEQLLHVGLTNSDRLFFFTTCGWMMWNWLVSALAIEATVLLYDGSPFHPDGNAMFDFADEERCSVFGTSAKFIDAVNKSELKPRQSHDLSSIHTLLSTGSPLAPEGFDFVYRDIKDDLCLSSISGGTDICGCFALGNPTMPVWRGEIQCLALGLDVRVFSDNGESLQNGRGELVCCNAFPSMPVGFWNDDDGSKYHAAYFEKYANTWCHGDYVELTAHGGMIIHGRSDAVLNPGGVRIGTAEIYRQAEQLPEIVESLVIGQKWQADVRVVLFVKLATGLTLDDELIARIKNQIRQNTTPRHVPARVIQVDDIPRTKSGKIVELAVRKMVHGEVVKNVEALANPEALEHYRDREELKS